MSEREGKTSKRAEQFFGEFGGTGFETKKVVKENVYEVIIEAYRLMEEDSFEAGKELLGRAWDRAQELHNSGQFSEPYFGTAGFVIYLTEKADRSDLVNVLKEDISKLRNVQRKHFREGNISSSEAHISNILVLVQFGLKTKLLTEEDVRKLGYSRFL